GPRLRGPGASRVVAVRCRRAGTRADGGLQIFRGRGGLVCARRRGRRLPWVTDPPHHQFSPGRGALPAKPRGASAAAVAPGAGLVLAAGPRLSGADARGLWIDGVRLRAGRVPGAQAVGSGTRSSPCQKVATGDEIPIQEKLAVPARCNESILRAAYLDHEVRVDDVGWSHLERRGNHA